MVCLMVRYVKTISGLTQVQPQKICGDKIIGFKDSIHTQSFIGILWSNSRNNEGKFEIEARCTGHPIPTAGLDLP